ncbi:UTP--glucose-1-phosphate uridylyltransferase GalU [Priestia endophytica]|uniref:UTP--glucose-1-phosphate uridylyltransferase GalU n=1 Tax=Priestia endophytica TaxID=135735 RepID=UPI00228295BF|nr:UTP--glucose-1-phosphate uridylyltransferase GalU [Priestia endophytica]MCY8233245.1 UTP--glucose-1-phosphate uridylyltransferase GalU [Priestia endophytica]
MKKVRKAVIPAAGLGTRFLPVTKSIPKEMLPIVNKPTIQIIVEEALKSGIEDIIIVTGKGKQAIENHFDYDAELQRHLSEQGKEEQLNAIQHVSNLANIHYVRQKEPKGLGHAISCARTFIGDEPFAVLLGDDLTYSEEPCLKQLIKQYEKKECSVVGVQPVPTEEISRYGVIDPAEKEHRLYRVDSFVEKPQPEEAPSNLAIIGRYVFTPEIFTYLEKQKEGKGGEIQLTDAIEAMNELQAVFAYQFEGQRYDAGEPLSFLLTNISFALEDKELREPMLKELKKLVEKSELHHTS